MQKTTTLKDFKVFVLKTILATFVLSICFLGGSGQNLQSKKTQILQARPTQTDAKSAVVQQKAVDPRSSEAAGIAYKQQLKAQAANGTLSGTKNSAGGGNARVVTPARSTTDNPAMEGKANASVSGKVTNPNNPTVACLYTGSLGAPDATMPLRLFRPGTAGGTCAAPQPFPGTAGGPSHFYDTYTIQNTQGATACVTVNLTTTDLVNANIQAGAWLGSFNPANLATNYIADPYVSSGTPAAAAGLTFSFNLANGATAVLVVWSANASTTAAGTASNYTLSVDGLPNLCPQPPCVPPTSSTISAISIPLNEGFDGTIAPAGWSIQNNSSPIGAVTWNQGNANGVFTSHSGAGYASVNFNSGAGLATLNNWLIGPTVTLHNGDQFKFWARAATGGGIFPDRLQARFSTNGASTNVGTTATDVGDFSNLMVDINPTYSTTGFPEVWTQFTGTVSGVPAAGVQGRVAFRYFVENGGPAGANSNYIGVDDAQYIASGTPSVCSGGTAYLKVDIQGGTGPFTVKIQPTPPGTVASQITVANYNSGDLIPVSPTVATTYTLVSVTASGSGSNCTGGTLNGSAQVNITPASTAAVLSQVQVAGPPTQLISEDFAGAFPPVNWFLQNNSNPVGSFPNWFKGVATVFPAYAGPTDSYAAANFQATTGTNTISEWMLTPSVAMKNGDVLTFYTRTTTGTFPDRMQVRMNAVNNGTNVGTTPTSVGDFTTLLLDINPTYTTTGYPTAWTKFTITMSGLPAAGVNSRFAFRYFVEGGGPTGNNSDYIGVDSVRFTTFPLINPTTCTGSTANLKVDITGGNGPYTVVIGATPAQAGFPKTVTNYVSGAYIPVTPPFTTTYNLISVTSADGCAGTGNSGNPTITVSPTTIGPLQIVDDPTGPLCQGNPKLLTVVGAPTTTCFTNAGAILVPGVGTSGPGAPYPATITVSGLPTSGVTVKNVTLTNMNHTWTSDVDIVLQSPTGENVILLSDFGGSNDLSNTTITFDDAAATTVTNVNPIPSGTFKPTNVGTPDDWPAPGPTGVNQANPTLATFVNNVNGVWKLYTNDQAGGDAGNINGGYQICFNVPSAPPAGYTWLWTPATGLSSTTTNPVAASPMQTTTYTVMGTAPNGCQTTAAITITVLPLPAVTQNPVSQTVCAGSTVTFTGAGTGSGVNYQWQVSTNGGGTWTNITNGAPYSGATTSTLTINPAAVSMNNYQYRLVVGGTCPPSANSTAATLTVIAQPNVTVSPNGTVCGGVAGISGLALTASGANTYTWAPTAGLYTNSTATTAYTGGNANPVYAAPSVYTTYTVTGTNTTTGCTNTASVSVNSTPPPPLVTPNPVAMCLGDAAVHLNATSSVPGTATVNSGAISVAIPDANGTNTQNFLATSVLNVSGIPANATITGIRVNLSVPAHTYPPDLSINLKSPSGTIINLFRNLGGTAGSNMGYPINGINNLTLSSASSTSLATLNTAGSTATVTGTFKADLINTVPTPGYTLGDPPGFVPNANSWTPMYANAAGAANGAWTLGMTDDGAGDVGSLTNWSITIDYFVGVQTTAATWSPNAGLWLDPAATVPYTGTAINDVYVKEPAAGTYTYNVTVQSLPPAPVTIATPMAGGNANSMIFFNIKNNNTIPYTLNTVRTNTDVSGTTQGRVWTKFNVPGGNPGTISAAAGWTASPLITVNAVAGAQNVIANNLNLSIPPGQTVTVGCEIVSGATIFCAYTNGTGTLQTISSNGIDVIIDGNVGWGGPNAPGPPANNPRNFNGSVDLTATLPTCTSPARVVTVTVSNPVVITTQPPLTRSVCTSGTNNTTTLTVAATGSGVAYQWQYSTDNGVTWNNVANDAVHSGATTGTLTITNPPVSYNGRWYSALVSGVAPCPSVRSGVTVLTVNPLPTITLSASPYRNLLPGLQTAITATSSPAAATYTWFFNGAQIAANSNPLTVNVDGIGDYKVRILDVNGCTNTSGTFTIGDSTSGRVWIYPNPTTGQFGVRYNPAHNQTTPFALIVRNATGQLVYRQKYTLGRPFAPMNVNLSNAASGTYWVEVVDIDDNRLAVGRVVVAR